MKVGARAVAVAEDGTVYLAGNTDGNFAGENRGGSDIWVGRIEITFD